MPQIVHREPKDRPDFEDFKEFLTSVDRDHLSTDRVLRIAAALVLASQNDLEILKQAQQIVGGQ